MMRMSLQIWMLLGLSMGAASMPVLHPVSRIKVTMVASKLPQRHHLPVEARDRQSRLSPLRVVEQSSTLRSALLLSETVRHSHWSHASSAGVCLCVVTESAAVGGLIAAAKAGLEHEPIIADVAMSKQEALVTVLGSGQRIDRLIE